MRKTLEVITLAALALLVYTTGRALFGPNRLPDRIPTNFDLSGHPVGWGSSAMLLLAPAVAIGLYLLITVVARFPSAFNYPWRVTGANRQRMEALALNMITWLKAELICLFAWLQTAAIHAARNPGEGLAAGSAMVPVSIVVVFGTIVWHFVAMRRAAHA
jgi:hypothetical protein